MTHEQVTRFTSLVKGTSRSDIICKLQTWEIHSPLKQVTQLLTGGQQSLCYRVTTDTTVLMSSVTLGTRVTMGNTART